MAFLPPQELGIFSGPKSSPGTIAAQSSPRAL